MCLIENKYILYEMGNTWGQIKLKKNSNATCIAQISRITFTVIFNP